MRNNIIVTLGGLAIISVISTLSLSSAFATDTNTSQDNVTVSVPVSCTMNGTGMTSHTANIPNGTYESEIGTTTLKSFCNDSQGFAIYAIGYTNEEYGNTNLIGTSGGQTIVTGTATTTGNPDISNWAVKLATDSTATYPLTLDNSFGSYSSVPSSYTKVAHRDSGTDLGSSATGATLTTTYAAYISKNQKADTYDGKVKFTLVHPSDTEAPLSPQTATSDCINYFPNGSDVVGTMGCQPISDYVLTGELLASNFSRVGYGFAGWSDSYDYATNPNAKLYGPQGYIKNFTAEQYTSPNNGLSLYAVWVKSAGTLQTDATNVCNTLTTAPTDDTANLSSVSALTDERDNQTYAIAKLADGKCWMIENLRLESNNSDNSTGLLAQGYGTSSTYGNFSGLATAESTNFFPSSTANANSLYYSGTQEGTASIDIGTTNNPGFRMPRYNNTNTSARASSPSANNASMYSYGNYYTWHAAIADTKPNETADNSSDTTSICPSGWRLPRSASTTVNNINDFYLLSKAIMDNKEPNAYPYGDNSHTEGYYDQSVVNNNGVYADLAIKSFPNNFLLAGCYGGPGTTCSGSLGASGQYWSSTSKGDIVSLTLEINNTSLNPGGAAFKYKIIGENVRCVAGV